MGDPDYYGRYGFQNAVSLGFQNASGVPDQFLLARGLTPDALQNAGARWRSIENQEKIRFCRGGLTMTALKTKWSEMSRYRRVLLLVMAIEILAFFFATLVMINRPGLEYQDALLYPGTDGEISRFTRVRWTEKPPGLPCLRSGKSPISGGDYTPRLYQISEDPPPSPTAMREVRALKSAWG